MKFRTNAAGNSRPVTPLNEAGSSGFKRKLPTDLAAGGNSNGASENSNSPNSTPAKRVKTEAGPSSFAGAISNNKEYVSFFVYIYFIEFWLHSRLTVSIFFFAFAVIMELLKKLFVAIWCANQWQQRNFWLNSKIRKLAYLATNWLKQWHKFWKKSTQLNKSFNRKCIWASKINRPNALSVNSNTCVAGSTVVGHFQLSQANFWENSSKE